MNYPTVKENDRDEGTDSENSFLTASSEILAEAVSSLDDNTQMKYPAFLEEILAEAVSSLEDNTQMKYPAFLEGESESGPAKGCETMNYPTVKENDRDEGTDSENSFHTGGLEILAEAVSSLEDNTQMKYPAFLEESGPAKGCETMNYPTVKENDRDEGTDSENSFHTGGLEILAEAVSSLEDNTQMKYPAFLEGESESGPAKGCETMNYPTVKENDRDEGTDSENSFHTGGLEILAEAVSSLEDNTQMKYPAFLEGESESGPAKGCETMNYPTVKENDRDEGTDSENSFHTGGLGYLGDPRRNVRMLDIHLMTAQKEATPKHAARYLVRILFSKEIMISSSVAVNSQGRQPLDPNKMAAIREHLAAIFPNHDLRECGKDWQACISDINSLICHLCSKRTPILVEFAVSGAPAQL
ncbi:BEN domain-containing protein 2 [Globicephala melas]|uniref:BEN domain-containing protein 2 n=1 Tax=Globicephala melas TaxID=9731 RepID=UPI00293D72C7|nr:BEN domain-containing protein 2 [Globicephala melas]